MRDQLARRPDVCRAEAYTGRESSALAAHATEPATAPKKPAMSARGNTTVARGRQSELLTNSIARQHGLIELEWLDLKVLTRYVSVSRRTLTEWLYREHDRLPASRIGNKLYVRRSDFDCWMESHRVEAPVDLGTIVDEVMADLEERK